ncbi:MAG: Sec-independent protein translocase protein TatB [Acidimicrobiia bacterium]
MFDISGPELLTILLVALIVVGPRRLPDLIRRLGRWTAEVRRAVRELRTSLDKDVKELTEPLEEAKEDLTQPLRETEDELKATIDEANEALETTDEEKASKGYDWVGPKPISGPTPEDAMDDLSQIEEESQEEAS